MEVCSVCLKAIDLRNETIVTNSENDEIRHLSCSARKRCPEFDKRKKLPKVETR